MNLTIRVLNTLWFMLAVVCLLAISGPLRAETAPDRRRVVVSSDIGGTDPDDFQSAVHLLLCADSLDIEGIISSPFGPGRKADILKVIDCYESDYPKLKTHCAGYPEPDVLRSIAKQGETAVAPYSGVREATEGSEWIIQCARKDDTRPLHLLVWGGIEDLAQALHDVPDILPKLRVYWIAGPNKKWSPDAYQYIAVHHPGLWMIEANSTYRGWFVGGNQTGEWNNTQFVTAHVAGKGALGKFFATQLGGKIKMGDSPSVGWLLKGDPAHPSRPGWGGRFVRAWDRSYSRVEGLTSEEDEMELFGILELVLPLGDSAPEQPVVRLLVDNQDQLGHIAGDGTVCFRFCPKDAKKYQFTIRSNVPGLDGMNGGITAVAPRPEAAKRPSPNVPNWWTDSPDPQLAEGPHQGAKTVSRWREDFLADFTTRLERTKRVPGD